MTRRDIVRTILHDRPEKLHEPATAFAPSNIALCKYWGKRDEELNLPVNGSLSISLGHLGTETTIQRCHGTDRITHDGELLPADTSFAQRVSRFLDLFRSDPDQGFKVETNNNIPTAAGLASSASGFAALVQALCNLHGWDLSMSDRSILARLGSGSACRSLAEGFVEWHPGKRDDGMDSYGERLDVTWPNFRIATITLADTEKPVGSRAAMKQTRATSALYRSWPDKATADLTTIRAAILTQDFHQLGQTAENNSLSMHATMIGAWPPIVYWIPESLAVMHRVWEIRNKSVPVYFTMDAGPNVKLLFEKENEEQVHAHFPNAEVIQPFG